MSKNELSVRLCEKPVGSLHRVGGTMRFHYEPSAKRPLSMSMPLNNNSYGNRYCEAFFGGLLPESTKARTIIGRLFDINANNSFNLLSAIGYDCAGAASLRNPNDPVAKTDVHKLKGKALDDKKLATYLKDLPKRPLLAHIGELRISLAGVQDKAALSLIKNQFCLPEDDSPSTHILKPPIEHLDGSVQNEYFCLRLAAALGMPAAKVEVHQASNVTYLAIERFDRIFVDTNTVKRIHQEDFCQASGIVSTSKYQSDGGPALKQCFDLLDKTTAPALSRKLLLDLVLFNYLVGNADAHGKNFSFLHYENGTTKLAPAYDILCTHIYKDTTNKMAMTIGGENQFNLIRKQHWEKFCTQNKLSFTGFRDRCAEIIENINMALPTEHNAIMATDFAHPIVTEIVDYIKLSSKTISRQLGL